MIVNTNDHNKIQSLFSHLPDIVNDCEQEINRRLFNSIHHNDDMKITCKKIAHSLRFVADQVDKKYCQDIYFNHNLQYLSIRFVFHTIHIRTILSKLWTQSLLPFILLFCKIKPISY